MRTHPSHLAFSSGLSGGSLCGRSGLGEVQVTCGCSHLTYFVILYEYRHKTLFYCGWLYCASQILFFFFYKSKVYGNSKSVGAIFPTAFAHFRSVSHFGNSPTVCVMAACGQ